MPTLNLPKKSGTQRALEPMFGDLSRRLTATQQDICPVDFMKAFTDLCLTQSCGKCVPCRVGLAKASEIMEKILNGEGTSADLDLLQKTAEAAAQSSDCAIGYHAGGVILEGLAAFRSDFESHIGKAWCAARAEHSVPCVDLCPAHVDIPGYIALAHEGRYGDAVRLIRKDNPLPAVCGLICEHPCEHGCRRNMLDDGVNIRGIKRYAVEQAGSVPPEEAAAPTGKKVAVIGAGPAGLTCAYYLALMGHKVEIFERQPVAGGMLYYGIPRYRLPRKVLEDEINTLLATGDITLHLNTDIGRDVPFAALAEDFDSVFISIGSHAERKLGIEGENLHNIIPAVSLLRDIGNGKSPDFSGKKVAVIGGGNVAMDCARTSVRLGAKQVSIVYRRRQEDMTALNEEIMGAVADGCGLVTMMAPARLEGDAQGNVNALYVKPQLIGAIDKSGRPSVSDAAEDAVKMDVDVVIVAIGQATDSGHFAAYGLPVNRNCLVTDSRCGVAEFPHIFAGGDCVTGPASAILAIAAGKTAARNIDGYLGFDHAITLAVDIPPASLADKHLCGRVQVRERDAAERRNDFFLMEYCMTAEEARQESGRCLRCDRFGYGAFRGGRCVKW